MLGKGLRDLESGLDFLLVEDGLEGVGGVLPGGDVPVEAGDGLLAALAGLGLLPGVVGDGDRAAADAAARGAAVAALGREGYRGGGGGAAGAGQGAAGGSG